MRDLFCLDVETNIVNHEAAYPRLIASGVYDGKSVKLHAGIPDNIEAILEGHSVNPNIAFDYGVIQNERPELSENIFKAYQEDRVACTLTDAKLIQIEKKGAESYDPSLQDLAKSVLKEDLSKDEQTRYEEVEFTPIEQWHSEFREYLERDVQTPYRINEVYENAGYHNLQPKIRFFEARAAFALHLCGRHGIKIDTERAGRVSMEIRDRVKSLREELYKEGFFRLEKATKSKPEHYVKNKEAVQKAVEKAYGGKPPYTEPSKRYPNGQISTERLTLEDSGDELLEKLAEYSTWEKPDSSFLPTLKLSEVRARYNVLVNSGRTSCSKPNVQQFPRKGGIRECCIAREGKVIAIADYSMFEAVTGAQDLLRHGPSKFAELLQKGIDPHRYLMSFFTGRSQEEVNKDERDAGKAGIYGYPGGMKAHTFTIAKRKEGIIFCELLGYKEPCRSRLQYSNRPGVPPVCKNCFDISERLRNQAWLKAFPEYDAHFKRAEEAMWAQKIYSTGNGMVRALPNWNFKKNEPKYQKNAAANHFFQNPAAQIIKDAMWHVTRECWLKSEKSPLYGARLMLSVHDELGVECDDDKGHECAKRLEEIMVRSASKYCPDIPMKAEPYLTYRLGKGLKPVFKDGRLTSSTPRI